MIGKDPSATSKEALMTTAPGKQMLKAGLLRSKGYKQFSAYKKETEDGFGSFADRFARDLRSAITSDGSPSSTQQSFEQESGQTGLALESADLDAARARLSDIGAVSDRVSRILDSNFVKMTFPVMYGLFDAAAVHEGRDSKLRQDMVEGHMLAIDLSEPMDRIADKDEDLEYLDDYRLMCPYILGMARERISKGGSEVLESFERGFAEAREGQKIDEQLKSRPNNMSAEDLDSSYRKYRSVMGTAGRNMALARRPLGEVFYAGMAHSAEAAGCGNEIEDSLKLGRVKIPSWPLYYTLLCGDVERGFDLALKRADAYVRSARLALESLPEKFEHRDFLEFLFLAIDHYNRFWHGRLSKSAPWDIMASNLPGGRP